MEHDVLSKTILIIEINNCHFETIPGYCKYLHDLGYNVEVLTRHFAAGVFSNLKLDNVRIFECNEKTFEKIFKNFNFSKYERILYNSKTIYQPKNNKDIHEYYKNLPSGHKRNIYVQHGIELIDKFPNDIQIILANPANNPTLNKLAINPNYFGNIEPHKPNGNITKFISIGRLDANIRNTSSLVSAVHKLHDAGKRNFKITIIGQGKFEDLAPEIRQYFDILGKVDFPTLFNKVIESDYILPLLDPQIEALRRYLTDGVSGTFQLIYGFLKPAVIEETFAKAYRLNDYNSIIYKNTTEDFADKMAEAINTPSEKYLTFLENLKTTVEKINKTSLQNLKGILDE